MNWPVFVAWRGARTGPGTAARVHDLREIVNAIRYVNRTGIPWEHLPHDFPPYKTAYDYYAKWEVDGTTQRVHDLLRDKSRRAQGRAAAPSAAVIVAQSAKTSANVAESSQGIDAGKKIKGRKRMALGLRPPASRVRSTRPRADTLQDRHQILQREEAVPAEVTRFSERPLPGGTR
ncbi:transposase [Streptomyces sp. NBC_00140]|uniref:transposase n=1 Tax=Streptomyces sp. NBC_00140 TaxID=2975664 RepID=UPI00225B2357|nr:transposase [Streptomyces sp. NBC_00140]MCX5328354.1 transposase [Streptomyces sp. NBC_00140]